MGFNVFDAIAGAAVGFLEGGPVGAAVMGVADGATGTNPFSGSAADSVLSGGGGGMSSLLSLAQLADNAITSSNTGSGAQVSVADLSALAEAESVTD